MAAGLMLEAIAARERKQASSVNAYDGLLPAPVPRKRAGKSLNSRFDRDLGNIASFDRAPVKPTYTPRADPAIEAHEATRLQASRYGSNGDRVLARAELCEGGNEGRPDNRGIWRKLIPPTQPRNLDPNLENILFPERKPIPHSSSDTYVVKTPSPPDQNVYQYGPIYNQGGYQQMEPALYPPNQYRIPPPAVYPQALQGYQPVPPSLPYQPHQQQQMMQQPPQQQYAQYPVAAYRGTPYVQAPPPARAFGADESNNARYGSPARNIYNPDHVQANDQYGYPPPQLAHQHHIPPNPQISTPRSRQHHPYLPLPSNHLPPPKNDFFSPDPSPAQPSQPTSARNDAPQSRIDQNIPPIHNNALTDPSAKPIPKYDHRLQQWILVPQEAVQSVLTQHVPRHDHFQRGQKRRADSSPHPLPRALEMAFEDLHTPTRPRRSAVRPDMRGKKGGRDLIKSLENQVEESSSADELNIRSADRNRNWGVDEVDMTDQAMINQAGYEGQDGSHSAKVSRSRHIDHRSRSRSVQQDNYMPEQPGYDLASQEASDSDTQSHHHPARHQDKKRSRRHGKTRTRKRSSSLSTQRAKVDRHRKAYTSHASRPIKQESNPSRQYPSYPKDHRSHKHRRSHSSSTNSDSYHYSSGSESGNLDSDNFTSPSNTPSSPSPSPDPRFPITRGAWGDYEVPADMLEYSEIRHHSRPSKRKERKVKSVPLSIHHRPRDSQGKFLPYAYTRSESPEQAIRAEEDEDMEEGEEIEGFTPSLEDRFSGIGVRQGLSPVIEVDEDEDVDVDVEMEVPAEVNKGSGKKKVRWRDDVKRHDASGKKGVNRLPKGWQLEFEAEGEDGEDENGDAGDQDEEDGERGEKTSTSKGTGGVSPFGEGFFDSDTAGEVGFQVWRDGV